MSATAAGSPLAQLRWPARVVVLHPVGPAGAERAAGEVVEEGGSAPAGSPERRAGHGAAALERRRGHAVAHLRAGSRRKHELRDPSPVEERSGDLLPGVALLPLEQDGPARLGGGHGGQDDRPRARDAGGGAPGLRQWREHPQPDGLLPPARRAVRGAHGGRRMGRRRGDGRRGAVSGGAGRGDDEAGGDRAEGGQRRSTRRCGRRHTLSLSDGPAGGTRGRACWPETPPGVSATSSQTPRLVSSFPAKPTSHTHPRVAEASRASRTGPGSGGWRPVRRRSGTAVAPGGAVGWRRPEPGLNGERRRGSAELREEARVSLPRLLGRAARPTLVLADPAVYQRRSTPRLTPRTPCPPTSRCTSSGRPSIRPRRTRGGAASSWPSPTVPPCAATSSRCRSSAAPGRWSPSSPTRRPRCVPDVRPEWPEPVELDAHLTAEGGAVTRLRFPSAVPVHEVLARLGVDAGSRGTAARGGLVVGGAGADGGPDGAGAPGRRARRAAGRGASPVTGRRAVVAEPGSGGRRRGGVQPDRIPTRRRWCRGRPAGRAGDRGDGGAGCDRPARCASRRRPTAYDVAALALAGVPLIADRPLPSGLDPALGAHSSPRTRPSWPIRCRARSTASGCAAQPRPRTRRWPSGSGWRRPPGSGWPGCRPSASCWRPGAPSSSTSPSPRWPSRPVPDLELVLAPHGFDVDPSARPGRGSATGPSSSARRPPTRSSATCSPRPPRPPRATWCSRWTTTTGTAPTS